MNAERNPDLELMILHSMLLDHNCFMSVAAVNPPADIFTSPNNYTVYKEAMNLFLNSGKAPTTNDVYRNLVVSGKFPGMNDYFTNRLMKAEFMSSTGYLVKLLCERAIEREIRKYFETAPAKGLDFATELDEFISKTLRKYIGGCVKSVSNLDTAEETIREIKDAMDGKFPNYLPTLIPDLDSQIIGIPKKQVTIIAARPGMGKTDFMLQLQRNFMKQNLIPCIFSLEMDAKGLLIRNISEGARINSMKIEKGELNDAEFKMLINAAKIYATDDFLIDDSAIETADIIKAKINYWRMRHNVNVVMIDYMTLIQTNYHQERYDLEIGALVRDLRVYAKEAGIPIIILSQLNRDSEKRLSHRPQISDLRESGSIEQEAGLVLMLYRPAEYGVDPFEGSKYLYYDQQANPLKADEYMEINVAKARSSKTGVVPVKYTPSVHSIESVKCVKL